MDLSAGLGPWILAAAAGLALGGAASVVLGGGRRGAVAAVVLALAGAGAVRALTPAPTNRWHAVAEDPQVGPLPAAVVAALPGPSPRTDLAGPEACRACHPGAFASWRRSFHGTMTQAAHAGSVRAPFSGELADRGLHLRLETVHDEGAVGYRVHRLDGPGGASLDRRAVVLVTGSHHLQNYWLDEPDGWFTQLPFAWHLELARWVPVQDTFLQPDLPTVQSPAVWNDNCVYCHTVGGAGGLSEDGQRAATRVDHLGIGCEACHGGGAAHAEVMRSPTARYAAYLVSERGSPSAERGSPSGVPSAMINPDRLGPEASRALCGQCHGVFLRSDAPRLDQRADAFRPGDTLAPTRHLFMPITDPLDGTRALIPPYAGAPIAVAVRLSPGGPGFGGPAWGAPGPTRPAQVVGVGDQGAVLAGDLLPGPAVLETALGLLPGHVEPVAPSADHPGPHARFRVPVAGPDSVLPALMRLLGYPAQQPMLYDLEVFWADGTVRSTGREANALAATACATQGALTCLSCHAMHGYAEAADQLQPRLAPPDGDPDAACADCHPAEVAAASAHSHHPPGAAACVDCHQPYTTFGLLGVIRSHRIDRPTAAMSARHGRPNACNLCHLDQPLAFTAEWLERWYGQPPPPLDAADRTTAAAVRWLLAGDAAQRGVTAFAFGWPPARRTSGETWAAPLLAAVLDDDYAAVRKVAADALRRLPGMGDLSYDFVGLRSGWREAAAEARRRWARQSPDRTGAAVLVEGPGRADAAAIEALRAARDRRPVHVSE